MKSKRCFLAIIDLLGFSKLVLELKITNAALLLRRFQSITRNVVSITNKNRLSHGIDKGRQSKLHIFSDLILVHSEADSHDDCMDIIEICSRVFRIGCENGFLPRGAIAWGEMIITSKVIVGQPLVEAHLLEAQQEWAGITLCNSMHKWDLDEGKTKDHKTSILSVMKERKWLISWSVPTKSRRKTKRLAINWLTFEKGPYWHTRFTNPKKNSSDPKAQAKLQNTEKFYRHISQF